MKKLLVTLVFLLLPAIAWASTAAPWTITNLTDPFIFPTQINGSAKGIIVNAASSTITFLSMINSTTTNATTTSLEIRNLASTTQLIVSSAGGTAGCATFSTNGTISNTGVACGTGSGSGGGSWATTTSQVANQLINYSLNNTDIVVVGAQATTSAPFYIDPNPSTGPFLSVGSTSPFASISIHLLPTNTFTPFAFAIGSSTNTATTTLFSINYQGLASTTGLVISNTGGSGSRCLQTGADGTVSAISSGCLTLSSFSATSPILYNSSTGVISTSFSTSTTNIFTGTNTFNAQTNFLGPLVIGTSTASTTIWGNAASSTFASGINLTNGGCFAIAGVCIQTIVTNNTEFKGASNYASTSTLPANTYLSGVLTEVGNGALYVDGNNPTVGQRILVKNESTQTNNGIYTVTAAGSAIAAYVLTRATDFNTSAEIYPGVSTYVLSGTTNGDTTWTLTTPAPVTLDTSNLTFAESANGNITIPVTTAQGGTGQITLTQNQLLYGIGTGNVQSVATSSIGAGTGLSFSGTAGAQVGGVGGTYSVNTSQNIATLSNLTNNGFVTTSGGAGTLGVQQFPITTAQGGTNSTSLGADAILYTNHSNNTVLSTASSTLFGVTTPGFVWSFQNGAWGAFATSSSGGSATFAWPFTQQTQFGVNTSATTTLLQLTNGLTASSTSHMSQVDFTTATTPNIKLSNGVGNIFNFRILQDGSLSIATSTLLGDATSTTPVLTLTKNGQLSTGELAPATTTSVLIDWNTTPNQVLIQIGTSATTIGFNNASTTGMTKRILVCNPNATAGALTWAATNILWPGSLAPTQTTTANKCDTYSFLVTQATSTAPTTQKIFGALTAGY